MTGSVPVRPGSASAGPGPAPAGSLTLAALWRYPVKSMAGEALVTAELRADGVAGDRGLAVVSEEGRVVTARSRPGLLLLRATLPAGGEVLVDGRPWRSAEVERDVVAAAGRGARLVALTGPERFDVLPLLVATDGAISAFGRDVRRLRPNLVIGGVDGLDERGWEGRRLEIGRAVIRLADLRGRCVMTTVDPDTGARDPGVLRDIVRRFGGVLALNAAVDRTGTVRVGDAVSLGADCGPTPILLD